MAKVKQITAWVDSYPGTIGRIAKALGNAKVNITSFTAYGTGGESPIRLQVSSPVKAKKVLRDLGIRTTEEEVLRLTVSDKPGVLGEIGSRLGQVSINMDYAYATVAKGGKKVDVVLGVSDLAGAAKALKGI
ncbi:MAG: amino acid-binding protein [Acidobacteria bacterium]|nr:MAG: amino acid-binding protein [Acidobacteriota bacterium]